MSGLVLFGPLLWIAWEVATCAASLRRIAASQERIAACQERRERLGH